MCKNFVYVDGLMLDISDECVKPLSPNIGMSLISRDSDRLSYGYDDSVLFFSDVLGFVRDISLPKFYETVLPYIHPEYADVYFRNKSEFISDYVVDYEDLTDTEKVNLYDDIQLREPLKKFWYKETTDKDKALLFTSLSTLAQHREYSEGLAKRNNIFNITGEIVALSHETQVKLITRDILKDRGNKALEYFMPMLKALKVDFLNDNKKIMKQAYKTLVRAYPNEICKDYNNNIKIVIEISDDNEDFYAEVNSETVEGRLYASIRDGLFYLNDSNVSNYSLGLRDFLYELVCRLNAMLDENTNGKQMEFMETCITEYSKDSFARAEARFSDLDDVYDNFVFEQEVKALDFNADYVNTLTKLFKQCDRDFNKAIKKEVILNTRECLNVTSLCEYLTKSDDVRGIANIIEQMKEDYKDKEIDKQAIRKALYMFYNDFIIDKAFKILFGGNDLESKVNISMPRIGE